MNETVDSILCEMRDWQHREVLGNWPHRIEAAHKCVLDGLAKQREYDAKLEADFAAFRKENERLRGALRVIAKRTEGYADATLRAIHRVAADEVKGNV